MKVAQNSDDINNRMANQDFLNQKTELMTVKIHTLLVCEPSLQESFMLANI